MRATFVALVSLPGRCIRPENHQDGVIRCSQAQKKS